MRSDRPAAIIVLVIAAFYMLQARTYRSLTVGDVIGPAAYPLLIGGTMAVLAAILFIQSLRAPPAPSSYWPRHLRPLVFGIALTAYVLTFEWLGFAITTVVYLILSHRWLGEERWLKGTLVSVLITVALWTVFERALGVQLPSGLLGRLP